MKATRFLAWLAVMILGVAVSVYALRTGPGGRGHVEDQASEEAQPELLFGVGVGEWSAVEIVVAGKPTRFERDEQGRWFLHGHQDGAAKSPPAHTHTTDATAADKLEKAFLLLANARYDRIIASGEKLARKAYGLTHPRLIALVYRHGKAQPELTLECGDLAPDELSRYVLVPQRRQIVLLPDYQVANLRALVEGMPPR